MEVHCQPAHEERPDSIYMQRALELAERGRGHTCPNPLVGCVVVKDRQIISEGYHRKCGEVHAERAALQRLGPGEAAGSTLYVTLEPCCHVGRQPPCTELIISSGVRRVVVGAVDPNPQVSCGGIEALRAAGIEVTVGVLQKECEEQNRFFMHYMKTGLPYVSMKYAMTLDGKIAARTGDSKWVTGTEARNHVQGLRKSHAAILVGIGTVLADDPLLTCRTDPAASPVRVICDNDLRLPSEARLVRTAQEVPTLVICDGRIFAAAEKQNKKTQLEAAGVRVLTQDGKVCLAEVLRQLAAAELDSVLIEGGGEIHGSVLVDRLADYAYVYLAPKLLGGRTAPGPVGGEGPELMEQALPLQDVRISKLGEDYLFEGRLKSPV